VQSVAADICPAMHAGSTWIDCTTSSPQLVRGLAPAFADRGIDVLDAPVSGGPAGAVQRRLVFWVGGEAAAFERCRSVFACMADEAMHVGPLGCGLVTKLAHNAANFTLQAVLAEAFTLGVKAGVDPLVLFEALRRGSLGRNLPVDRLAEQFLPGTYDPASMALSLAHKDLSLALSLAADEGVPLRMVESACEDHAEAMRRGWAERDARIALTLQEERAGVSVRVDPAALRKSLAGKR
jgi:3-hydroxyisobutyrate dehydrogenase